MQTIWIRLYSLANRSSAIRKSKNNKKNHFNIYFLKLKRANQPYWCTCSHFNKQQFVNFIFLPFSLYSSDDVFWEANEATNNIFESNVETTQFTANKCAMFEHCVDGLQIYYHHPVCVCMYECWSVQRGAHSCQLIVNKRTELHKSQRVIENE